MEWFLAAVFILTGNSLSCGGLAKGSEIQLLYKSVHSAPRQSRCIGGNALHSDSGCK